MKKLRYLLTLCLFLCCALALSACGRVKLPSPVNLKINQDTLELSWLGVVEATGYVLDIGGREIPVNDDEYSLTSLEAGDYDIRVKAKADGKQFRDSDWSEPIAFTREVESGLTFNLINGRSEYEVTGAGMASGDIVIEDEYRGKPVTRIIDKAFSGNTRITGMVIGNNVKTIGKQAFYNCSKLESVTIPDSVTSIGESAFRSCHSLKSVAIPDSIKKIENYTFAYCRGLEAVTIGAGVAEIGDFAFSDCSVLKSVIIPDSVTSLGKSSFASCQGLERLVIGNGVTDILENTFFRCSLLTDLTIGSSVKTIGKNAFGNCAALETVAFPASLATIGEIAFGGCQKLSTVDFTNVPQSVASDAFVDTALIKNDTDNLVYADDVVIGVRDKTLTQINFKENTRGIASNAFSECNNLTEITLPDSIEYIDAYAFHGCAGLRYIKMGSGLKSIGNSAFSSCPLLDTVEFGANVKTIGNYAFYSSERMGREGHPINIPDSVTRIGHYAFYGTAIWNRSTKDMLIYADDWLVGFNPPQPQYIVTVRPGTAGVADYVFYKAEVNYVTLPDSIKHIGRYCFRECQNLLSVNIPANVTEIEEYTFFRCPYLMNVAMHDNVTKIGRSAFYDCLSLPLTLSASLVEIGDYAFYNAGSVRAGEDGELIGVDLVFGDKLKTIGKYAFAGCASVVSVTMPESLESIGDHAFRNCSALAQASLGNSVKTIGNSAFYNCGLASIEIPASVATIGNSAFRNCASLAVIKFSEGLKSIGDYAFSGCEGLENLFLPASLEKLGSFAFHKCTSLTSATLRASITEIGGHVFYGNQQITIFSEATEKGKNWDSRFNSSFRPWVWGCVLDETDGYVVSFMRTENCLSNFTSKNIPQAPTREGYAFLGWARIPEGAILYTADKLGDAQTGTRYYAVWTEIFVEE